jgi:hypothetical protein
VAALGALSATETRWRCHHPQWAAWFFIGANREGGGGEVGGVLPPSPPHPGKKWWKVELEMQAANRGAHDSEDASRQHLLLDRSINEEVSAATHRHAVGGR